MEHICNIVKDFIITETAEYLSEMEEQGLTLPAFTSDNVHLGYLDAESNQRSIECFIVPDSQTLSELSMEENETRTNMNIYVFVRKAEKDVLFKRAMRYGAAIKKAVQNNYSMGGNFLQSIITNVEYYDNVEDTDGKIRAIRLGLTVIDEETEV